MAHYERDYYRGEEGGRLPVGNRLRLWSVSTWIIILCVAVFAIDGLLGRVAGAPYLSVWGYFSASTAIFGGQVWRLITFQFLHGGIWHLFFNMLALYFFGPMIESHFGSRRYLAFYLLCGIGGAAMYLLLWGSGVLVTHAGVPLVGASAGVFGILIAAARLAPDTRVMLMFLRIPVTLRTLAWVFVGIAVLTILTNASNAGGEAAHLGGAAVGFLLATRMGWLGFLDRFSLQRVSPGAIRQKVRESSWQRKMQEQVDLEKEVDRILDKVAHEGMASLTAKEKRTLQRATEMQRKG